MEKLPRILQSLEKTRVINLRKLLALLERHFSGDALGAHIGYEATSVGENQFTCVLEKHLRHLVTQAENHGLACVEPLLNKGGRLGDVRVGRSK